MRFAPAEDKVTQKCDPSTVLGAKQQPGRWRAMLPVRPNTHSVELAQMP